MKSLSHDSYLYFVLNCVYTAIKTLISVYICYSEELNLNLTEAAEVRLNSDALSNPKKKTWIMHVSNVIAAKLLGWRKLFVKCIWHIKLFSYTILLI